MEFVVNHNNFRLTKQPHPTNDNSAESLTHLQLPNLFTEKLLVLTVSSVNNYVLLTVTKNKLHFPNRMNIFTKHTVTGVLSRKDSNPV